MSELLSELTKNNNSHCQIKQKTSSWQSFIKLIMQMTMKMKMQERRAKELEMEMVWESSQDLGDEADLFTGLMIIPICDGHSDHGCWGTTACFSALVTIIINVRGTVGPLWAPSRLLLGSHLQRCPHHGSFRSCPHYHFCQHYYFKWWPSSSLFSQWPVWRVM